MNRIVSVLFVKPPTKATLICFSEISPKRFSELWFKYPEENIWNEKETVPNVSNTLLEATFWKNIWCRMIPCYKRFKKALKRWGLPAILQIVQNRDNKDSLSGFTKIWPIAGCFNRLENVTLKLKKNESLQTQLWNSAASIKFCWNNFTHIGVLFPPVSPLVGGKIWLIGFFGELWNR